MHKTKQVILMTVLFILFLPAFVLAGTIALPKTGQTTCYNTSGAVIACPGTGQDGDIQVGVPWPNPRFTVSTDGFRVFCLFFSSIAIFLYHPVIINGIGRNELRNSFAIFNLTTTFFLISHKSFLFFLSSGNKQLFWNHQQSMQFCNPLCFF